VIHPRLCVNQASSIRFSLEEDLALFATEGVRDVSLLLRKLDDSGAGSADLARAIERVRAADLRVDNLAVGPCFELARPEQWPAGRDRLRSCLRTARALGSSCVVITTGGPAGLTWEAASDALERAIAPVVEEAGQDGQEIAVENTNGLRFDISFAHTLRDTIDLARRLGLGVCMEVNNVWCERGLEETIRRNVDALRIVQVNDFVVGTLQTPDRAVPGDGDIPLARILGWLLASGYERFFELEIVGPRIDAEGYAPAIRRSLDYLGDLLVSLGAN
jgi:sugar phosphate isomerase/epimerase